jgi:hypothetical protein
MPRSNLVMQAYQSTVCVRKLEAARRQLESAITLYFKHGDPVSLAVSAVGPSPGWS